MKEPLSHHVVERAQAGDRGAIEEVVRAFQRPVYNLALRMLADPPEAQDACQEILVKVITRLAGFRGEAAFSTWVFRVAANHLLDQRERGFERAHLPFEQLGAMIDEGLSHTHERPRGPQDQVLVEEARLACTHAMLVCLDRDQRLAFILGELLDVTSEEGAAILEVEPAAFRKRLSRARDRIESFMQGRCGLVNAAAPCRCSKQVAGQIRLGVLDPERLRFANHPLHAETQRIGEFVTTAAVFRGHPDYLAPEALAKKLREFIDRAVPH